MFRVRFVQHTPGYRPERESEKIAKRLATLLRRQGFEMSHTDEAGFTCYHQVKVPKRRTVVRARAVHRSSTRPLKRMTCEWKIEIPRSHYPRWARCTELATSWLNEDIGYCERHEHKAEGRERYWVSQRQAEAAP